MAPLHKTKELVKKLPATKPHLDFLAALLTIPVLITVIYLNLGNISKNTSHTPTPTPSPDAGKVLSTNNFPPTRIQTVKVSSATQPTNASCQPGIGQIDIASPEEDATVTQNPICIDIAYTADNYCSVVWAYKINDGPLSDYSNNSVCLYNLPSGQVTFELRVKSLANSDTKILQRTFTIQNNAPTFTPTPTAITPTPTPKSS